MCCSARLRSLFLSVFLIISSLTANADTSGKTLIFYDNFETGFGNWLNEAALDNAQWTRDSGGTPSSGTGPASGSGSSWYMYVETSSGDAYTTGGTAILVGPSVNETSLTVVFDYHMYGLDSGTLSLEFLDGGVWNSVWSVSGQQQNSNSAAYTLAEVDYSGNVDSLRFRYTAAGGFRGDVAIDNVAIWAGPSGPVAPVFDAQPIHLAPVRESHGYSQDLISYVSDANGDVLAFTKVSGPAWLSVSTDGQLTGTPSSADLGENVFEVEAFDGIFTVAAQVHIEVVDQTTLLPVSFADFETDLGDWQNVSSGDSDNWLRNSNGTPSSGTGPASGANSNWYVFLETSSGYAYEPGDTAILLSPQLAEPSIVQLTFDYHMYGADTGALAVDVLSEGNWINDVWTLTGQQHSSSAQGYSSEVLDLSAYGVTQLRYRATAVGGFTGDIALDNIEILGAPIPADSPPAFDSNPLAKPDAVIDSAYSENLAPNVTDLNEDDLVFVKLSGPNWLLVNADGSLSGVPSIADLGLNSFNVEVTDGNSSVTAVLEINVVEPDLRVTVLNTGFESGLEGWINDWSSDTDDWFRQSGATTSSNTGPASGSAGSAYYVYLETSSGYAYSPGESAILRSPEFGLIQNAELRFDYHMYGSQIGTLFVDVISNGGLIENVWSISGQQQLTTEASYMSTVLDLSVYPNITEVRFRGLAVGGFLGDIALDNIELVGLFAIQDEDGDGVGDALDQCPATPLGEAVDASGCSASQTDTDGDGVYDNYDAFPTDPTESVDTDNDGIGNNADLDDDGDGVDDGSDAYPLIALGGLTDTDSDGIPNDCDTVCQSSGMAADNDDDNDGTVDAQDAFPLDPNETTDTDGDGQGNNSDNDDDGDTVIDSEDAFPLDASESQDSDSDGIGNNADDDDDNDGEPDASDAFPLNPAEQFDSDGDGVGNNTDDDDDNDGVIDSSDAFPTDPNEQIDTDGDGIGNNADDDDDNDGEPDASDVFPLNPAEQFDSDGDGVGNNADDDDDNDGVIDSSDAFPTDPNEQIDTDGDGIGNNADNDDDNDGVADNADLFPLDPNESADFDGDGIGNNTDLDDDNDGISDSADAFPFIAIGDLADDDADGAPNTCDSACLALGMQADIDIDGDGLIEISTLDQFNNVRNELTGVAYEDANGSSTVGCGNGVDITTCAGYELTADLDFDENGNGLADDTYTSGEGWEPIGDYGYGIYEFNAIFEGNNHEIHNLMINVVPPINNSQYYYAGLFGSAGPNSEIRNLAVAGKYTSVNINSDYVAILAGKNSGIIRNVYVSGTVVAQDNAGAVAGSNSGILENAVSVGALSGQFNVGGLVGHHSGEISQSVSHVRISHVLDVGGGLVGRVNAGASVSDSFATGSVRGRNVGGLIGIAENLAEITNTYSFGFVEATSNGSAAGFAFDLSDPFVTDSYWAVDASGYEAGVASGSANGGLLGLSLSELKCPAAPDDPACGSVPLYTNWSTDVWFFGSFHDLPTLISIPVYRDSDSDGILDDLDAFPYDPTETADNDSDWVGDNADTDDDNDVMSDEFELMNGLDALNKNDADGDADGDTFTNLEEFLIGTDVQNSASQPLVTDNRLYSFEDQFIPEHWRTQPHVSPWSIDSYDASHGAYSLYTSVMGSIEFSLLFGGNTLQFDVKSGCPASDDSPLEVSVDDVPIDTYIAGSDWATYSFNVGQGVHTIKFDVLEDCGMRLDNIQIAPSEGLSALGVDLVVVEGRDIGFSSLYFYDDLIPVAPQEPVQTTHADSGPRDIKILNDERIAIFNGYANAELAVYDPFLNIWDFLTHPGWNILSNAYFGSIDAIGNYVFASDMALGADTTSGIIRFDLSDNSSARFPGNSYQVLTIGLDNKLYALDERKGIDVFNPETMELLNSIPLFIRARIAVDGAGNIYLGTMSGWIYKYDSDGNLLTSLLVSSAPISSIRISDVNEIYVASGGALIQTDTSLLTSVSLSVPDLVDLIDFMPQ